MYNFLFTYTQIKQIHVSNIHSMLRAFLQNSNKESHQIDLFNIPSMHLLSFNKPFILDFGKKHIPFQIPNM